MLISQCILLAVGELTRILSAIDGGDRHAASELLPLVYEELRKLAAQQMSQEKPGQTLDATALVHEAYVRLVDGQRRGASPPGFANGRHFFVAAAEAMRRILIERARQKLALKHGGAYKRVRLTDMARLTRTPDGLLAVDEALARFADVEPQKAELVKLRFFGGLSMPEVAQGLGISLATAERWWMYARAWLYAALADGE
jgi:RNA polymerase sigma factor (TIGR02999 family)